MSTGSSGICKLMSSPMQAFQDTMGWQQIFCEFKSQASKSVKHFQKTSERNQLHWQQPVELKTGLQSKVRNRRAKRATRSKVGSTGSDALPDATLKSQVRIIEASIQFQSCLCIRIMLIMLDKVAEFLNKTSVRDEKVELIKYTVCFRECPVHFFWLVHTGFILVRLFFWADCDWVSGKQNCPLWPMIFRISSKVNSTPKT